MSEFSLRHPVEIAPDHDKNEESEETLSEEEKNREFAYKWEKYLHNFRTSEAAEFLQEKNKESFDQMWEKLENFVYKIQKLSPQIRELLADVDAGYGYQGKYDMNSVSDMVSIRSRLGWITGYFKRENNWYSSAYLSLLRILPEADTKNLVESLRDQGLSLDDLNKGLLTTKQWKELDDELVKRKNQYIAIACEDDGRDVVETWKSLLKELDAAEKVVAFTEKEKKLPELSSETDIAN